MNKAWKLHPVCELFPQMTQTEFEGLRDDIQANGQQEPVMLYKGWLVDGKNRARACEELGIDCESREWSGESSVVAWAVSKNLHRRHLTMSERAVIAQQMLPLIEEEATARKGGRGKKAVEPGKSTAIAAKATGTSESMVTRTKAIAADAPDLMQKLKAGEITVGSAYEQLKQRRMNEVATDGLDNPVVDPRLSEVFGDSTYQRLMTEVQRLRATIKDLCDTELGQFLHHQTIDGYLQNVWSQLSTAKPFAPCPYCEKGCEGCKMSRWVTKILYDQAPDDLKD